MPMIPATITSLSVVTVALTQADSLMPTISTAIISSAMNTAGRSTIPPPPGPAETASGTGSPMLAITVSK